MFDFRILTNKSKPVVCVTVLKKTVHSIREDSYKKERSGHACQVTYTHSAVMLRNNNATMVAC